MRNISSDIIRISRITRSTKMTRLTRITKFTRITRFARFTRTTKCTRFARFARSSRSTRIDRFWTAKKGSSVLPIYSEFVSSVCWCNWLMLNFLFVIQELLFSHIDRYELHYGAQIRIKEPFSSTYSLHLYLSSELTKFLKKSACYWILKSFRDWMEFCKYIQRKLSP